MAEPGALTATATDAPTPKPPAPTSAWIRPVGWTALAVGGVALTTGVVTGIMAIDRHAQLESACRGSECPADRSGLLGEFHTLGDVATAATVVGSLALATSAVLLLMPRHEGRREPQSGFWLRPGGAGGGFVF